MEILKLDFEVLSYLSKMDGLYRTPIIEAEINDGDEL